MRLDIVITGMVGSLICLCSLLHADPSHQQIIHKSLDEIHFETTVHPNPTEAVHDLRAGIEKLRNEGITPVEVLNYVRANELDQSTRIKFDSYFSTLDGLAASPDTSGNLVINFMSGTNGTIVLPGVGAQHYVTPESIVLGTLTEYVIDQLITSHQIIVHHKSLSTKQESANPQRGPCCSCQVPTHNLKLKFEFTASCCPCATPTSH